MENEREKDTVECFRHCFLAVHSLLKRIRISVVFIRTSRPPRNTSQRARSCTFIGDDVLSTLRRKFEN